MTKKNDFIKWLIENGFSQDEKIKNAFRKGNKRVDVGTDFQGRDYAVIFLKENQKSTNDFEKAKMLLV